MWSKFAAKKSSSSILDRNWSVPAEVSLWGWPKNWGDKKWGYHVSFPDPFRWPEFARKNLVLIEQDQFRWKWVDGGDPKTARLRGHRKVFSCCFWIPLMFFMLNHVKYSSKFSHLTSFSFFRFPDPFWWPEFAGKNFLLIEWDQFRRKWVDGGDPKTASLRGHGKVFSAPIYGRKWRFGLWPISIRILSHRKMGISSEQVCARLCSHLPKLHQKMAIFRCTAIQCASKYEYCYFIIIL